MSREKNLAKNTFILSIGNLLPKAVSFITLPILTAYLTKAEYGSYDLLYTLASLFLPVVTLQIQTAAFRFLIEERDNPLEQKKIITNIYLFTIFTSFIALGILFFVLSSFSILTRVLICVFFFLDNMINTSRQVVRGIGKNAIYSASSVLNAVVNMAFIYLFVKSFQMGLDGVLASLTLALMLSQLYILIRSHLLKYIDFSLFDTLTLKKLLKYSWPMIPNSLSGWVMRLSDRLVITGFLGIEANAVYSVANKLPILYSVLQNTFTIAWQENASIASKDKDTEKYYSDMFDTMYRIFYSIMALLIVSTPLLFAIMIKGDYDEAYYQMPILYIGAFFNSLSSYMGGIYVARMETKKVGITTTVAAAMNLLIDFMLINVIGIYAGSISTLVSYLFLVIYRMIDVQKIQKMHFNIPRMLLLLGFLIAMSVLSYQRMLVLDILNVVIAVATSLLFNRKVIVQVFKAIIGKFIKKKT